MTSGLEVRLPGGGHTNDLFHAGNQYFRQHFPDWSKDRVALYCFPAIFEPTFRESTDPEASGRKEMERKLKDITEGDIKGQAAEYEIWKMFNKFSSKFETSVFLFRGFKFDQTHGRIINILLSNHNGKETDAELPSFESDYTLFDKSGHIIVLETKGGNKLVSGGLKKAKNQTMNCKRLLDCLSKLVGGSGEIPVQRFHVFPFVIQKNRDPSVVTGFDLICFSLWWKSVIDRYEDTVPSKEHPSILEAIICPFAAKGDFSGAKGSYKGPATSLDLRTDMLETEHARKIDEDINTQRIKTKGTNTNLVITAPWSPFHQDKALVIYNLTPEQFSLYNSKRRCQIIDGVAGSGKTILVKTKSLELAKNGEKVLVVVTPGMLKNYIDFYKRNNCLHMVKLFKEELDGNNHHITLPDYLEKESHGHHVFVDDMQTYRLWTHDKEMTQLTRFMKERLAQESSFSFYTWFVIDFYQGNSNTLPIYFYEWSQMIRNGPEGLNQNYISIDEKLRKSMQVEAASKRLVFEWNELSTTLRNSIEILLVVRIPGVPSLPRIICLSVANMLYSKE